MKFLKIIGPLFMILILSRCASTPYSDAEKHLENRRYDQALKAYLQLLDPHSRNGKRYIYFDKEATTGIGLVYWNQQRYKTALQIFQMVAQKEPTYGKALFYMGMSYEGLAQHDDAIRSYRRYAEVDPLDPYRKIMKGRLDWIVQQKITREIRQVVNNELTLDAPDKSVAVLYFLNLSEDSQWESLQKGLAEMMITDLSQVSALKVIERVRINQIMEELDLSTSGLVEESSSPRLGSLLGVKNFVKGSYLIMPDSRMTLDATVFESRNRYLPMESNYEGLLPNLFRMEKELVLQVLDHFDVEITSQEREQILKIPTENMMAFMDYCRGLDALDMNDFKKAQGYFENAVKQDINFQQAKDNLMSVDLWNATHNRNFIRVNREVAQLVKRMPREARNEIYRPEELLTAINRLRWMGAYQNAGFVPGNDTRSSFQEAENAISIIPQVLAEPPKPPGQSN